MDKNLNDNNYVPAKPKLKTNRKKAIIFANLYMIFHFAYFCCAKISMKSFDVNGLDLCLFRTTVVCFTSSL
jgi:hypothetical protein